MSAIDDFRAELEREVPRTRRVLAEVPADRDDWKPHDKSMPLVRLASLVAGMCAWVPMILDQDELDLTPPPGQQHQPPPSTTGLVAAHDGHVAKALAALAKRDEKYLRTTNWRLRAGGHVVMDQPRIVVLRDTINHLAHHRGQLTVYLRLLDRKVPSTYGPTADDQTFG